MVFKRNTDPAKNGKSEKPSLLNELRTLDVKNYGEWSKTVQAISFCFMGVAVAAFGFIAFIGPVQSNITNVEAERELLISQLKEKRSEVSGLEQYKLQSEEMERNFNIQLQQLPKESEIPGLVDDIHRAGATSGLKLQNLELQDEVPKEFFIEQPIAIVANGQFHNFGDFVQRISALPRIVTVQDFSVNLEDIGGSNQMVMRIPKLKYSINAKTYRYLENTQKTDAKAQFVAN